MMCKYNIYIDMYTHTHTYVYIYIYIYIAVQKQSRLVAYVHSVKTGGGVSEYYRRVKPSLVAGATEAKGSRLESRGLAKRSPQLGTVLQSSAFFA